jgi:AcrR family transcriptional regulator
MRRLADRADVSVRTLYNLFGDKDGLLTALVQHSLDAIHVAHRDIKATDPIERIWEVVTITVETTVRSLPRAVLATVLSDEELYGRLERRWRGRELTVDAVRAATRAGALRDDLPTDVVVDHAGMVHRHLLRRWAVGEIGDRELHTSVLQAYDLSLLAVAKPRMRARLLEHAAGLRASRQSPGR